MSKIYSIYPTENFFDNAADIILNQSYNEAEKLNFSNVQIWVPSNRIAQSLIDTITIKLGNYAILPEVKTISFDDSDVQSLKFYDNVDFLSDDVLSPASKLLYFAKAIDLAMPDWTFAQAFIEAPSLVKLHQDLQNYNVSLEELNNAVPFELSTHWEKNLHIVKVVFKYYDDFLAENNKQDKYKFQNNLIELYLKQYEKLENTNKQVYAVGFNDTTTLGKKVLKKVAEMEQSTFIFPYINSNYFGYNLEPSNSQFAVHNLFLELNLQPNAIQYIGKYNDKVKYIDNVFLPYEQTHEWYNQKETNSFDNLAIINAENTLQEAKAIALTMREVLETKDKTCAMVSPNKSLTQNVIKELHKWGVEVNDSAGVQLSQTLKGQFALNILEMVENDFSTETIIPTITSPAISIDKFKFNFINAKENFIKLGVLGTNVEKNLEFIVAKIKQQMPWQNKQRVKEESIASSLEIAKLLKSTSFTLDVKNEYTLSNWALKHLDCLLTYLSNDNIFDNDDGKALAEVILELKSTDLQSKIDFKTYYQTFKVLAEQTMVRKKANLHPRLFIWGAPESRLQKVDRVILADFNDATWPGSISSSLWLNPSIRKELNMPDVSVANGLNANDVINQLYADEVIISRSKKDENGDTVPSRFLVRLESSLHIDNLTKVTNNGNYYLNILDEIKKVKVKEYLQVPKHNSLLQKTAGQALPTEISASAVKDLANCPYKFFLNKIVYLSEIDDIEDIPANIWGSVVHLVLELFYQGKESLNLAKLNLPLKEEKTAEYKQRFNIIIEDILAQINSNIIDLSWRGKLYNIANQFIEISLQENSSNVLVEQEIKYGNLKAVCDRIEQNQDGWTIGDYKTGKAPSATDMLKFRDPQLMVESYILQKNNKPVTSLKYWDIKGYGEKAIEVTDIAAKIKDFDSAKAEGFAIIEDLLATFANENTSFIPQVNGTVRKKEGACKYCPYAGICRGFKL